MRIGKLVVVGVGLIGGSAALALKRAGCVGEVVGVGRTQRNLDAALAAGIVDRAFTLQSRWTGELDDADVVLLATPVAQVPALLAAIVEAIGPRTIVTDAGSTKRDVIAAAREHLKDAIARFVPAHPIAGNERAGAEAAVAGLYEGRNVVVTPLDETDASALDAVEAMWKACGARVVALEAGEHDRIFAAVSHLPHLIAAAFMADLAVRPDADRLVALAGSGFRDFTRIAASSPEMWRDIAIANRIALVDELAAFRGALDVLEAALRDPAGHMLLDLLTTASDARRTFARTRGE